MKEMKSRKKKFEIVKKIYTNGKFTIYYFLKKKFSLKILLAEVETDLKDEVVRQELDPDVVLVRIGVDGRSPKSEFEQGLESGRFDAFHVLS